MDFFATCLLCFFIILLFILWTKTKRDGKWPPGPKTIPFLGNLNMNHADILGEFRRFRREYGDVFSLILGSQTLIVVNGLDTLKEFFIKHGEFVSARPNSFIFKDICDFEGIIGSSGDLWKEHRTFAIATLRSFGFGKRSFEGNIREEVEVFLNIIGEYGGKAFDLTELVHISTSNVVCSVNFGLRYDHNDRNFQRLCALMSENMKNANLAGIMTFFPFLKYLPFDPFKYSKIMENKEKIMDQLRCVTEERRDHFDQNITNNYVDAYLKRQNEDLKSGKMSTFTDDQLLKIVGDLFAAGTETTATAIKWFVVFILNNPDIQRRMREEIYENIGHSRLPSLEDKDRMTYCDAVIHETLRLSNIVPLSVPHGATEEFCFRDYIIPKGATLIPNLDSVAHDHELFEDPFDFKPSRFLDEKGNLIGTEKVLAFGIELHHVPSATYLNLRIPPTYDDIEFPESRKLKILDKVPPPEINRRFKMQKMKHLMRGEELVHNKLQYGQYGVQVLQGGRLFIKHIDHIRLFINRRIDDKRMFAMWRIESPWQAITKKGAGVKMGGGKKNIHAYVYPFKPRRIIIELGGHMEFEECEYLLNHVANILPVKARAVSRQILEEEEKKERKYQEENLNPFNFMYCARNNFVGIKQEISKYEWMTDGRYR